MGNLGIGTDDPIYGKLDVRGEIYAVSDGVTLYTSSNLRLYGTPIRLISGSYIYFNGTYVDMHDAPYMFLPEKTSAPSSPSDGMLVFNPTTGYTNVYHNSAWHHYNRDAGWA